MRDSRQATKAWRSVDCPAYKFLNMGKLDPRGAEKRVRRYKLYVEDDRSAAPVLVLVECVNDARAQEIALRYLAQSPHHHAVEVMQDGQRIFQADAPLTSETTYPLSASSGGHSSASDQ